LTPSIGGSKSLTESARYPDNAISIFVEERARYLRVALRLESDIGFARLPERDRGRKLQLANDDVKRDARLLRPVGRLGVVPLSA
jgi:hypothetical protein